MNMENIDSKLDSENPAVIAQVFSELYNSILKSYNEKAYLYLKNKCLISNIMVHETAKSTLLKLIQNGKYEISEVLTDFVTNISTSSNITPLTKVLFALLYLQLKKCSDMKETSTKFQLIRHPLIKILECNCTIDMQLNIYKEIVQSYNSISSEDLELLFHPLYLYCICSPILKQEMFFLKDNLWSYLLNIGKNYQLVTSYKLLAWVQVHKGNVTEITGLLLNKALESENLLALSEDKINSFVILQVLVCCRLTLSGRDCSLFFRILTNFISKVKFYHQNICLIILSRAIGHCSALHLKPLLELCLVLIKSDLCTATSYFAIKSSLLLWMISPSLLIENALLVAKEILQMRSYVCREMYPGVTTKFDINKMGFVAFCNPELFLYSQLEVKMKDIKDKELLSFLKNLNRVPVFFLKKIFASLCGILHLPALSFDIKKETVSLIIKCSLYYTKLLPVVLSNILYHLSNTQDNMFIFELLKTLPLMAHEKENILKVTATIQAIGNESNTLACFARYLLYKTWEIDPNCYSNLETLLLHEKEIAHNDTFEDNISKAYIIKMLAHERPELHGRDLVPHISKILNECTGSAGAIPCAMAIEGIKYLCKAEIIDIVRTWATLSPKFANETRIPVIKSICSFLYEIPHFSYTDSYEQLNDEVVQYLWHFVTENDNAEVINFALNALSSFRLELICFNIPSEFLDDEKTPENTEVFSQRTVSGKTWLKFLLHCKCREAAVNFITEIVSNEITNYLKYIYQIKKQKEPDNYGGLPTNSIVKVLGEYVKNNTGKVSDWEESEKEELFINCLRILSQKYTKPLPPFNWCFLQELLHKPKLKRLCIDIACHQAILSGSARRLVENYIVALTEASNSKEFIMIYENLKCIAKCIQPIILKPFFENSLQCALGHFESENLLIEMLKCLKSVLDDDDIQTSNKKVIEDILCEIIFKVDSSSAPFNLLLNCIVSFSEARLEQITRYNMIKCDEKDFIKLTKIRCEITCKRNGIAPFKWLNDVFTVAFKNNIRLETYMENVCVSIIQNINHPYSPSWVLELFGLIQAQVADRCAADEVQYFCDILTMMIVYFSGMFTLLPKNNYADIKYFFPASIAFLLKESSWNICTTQILEWLHHMNLAKNISQEYRNIFGWSLCCLRHHEEFSRNSNWMKYFDCEISVDTNKVYS